MHNLCNLYLCVYLGNTSQKCIDIIDVLEISVKYRLYFTFLAGITLHKAKQYSHHKGSTKVY